MAGQQLSVVCNSFDARIVPPLTAVTRHSRIAKRLGLGKILIVDDNDIDQLVATVLSGELGATVEVVSSGRHALETLEATSNICLVLMDCDMPEMSGLEATRQWRGIERGCRMAIPIVGLSYSGTVDRDRCLRAGMNDCLSKPLNRADVALCFARWTRPPASDVDVAVAKTATYEDERRKNG